MLQEIAYTSYQKAALSRGGARMPTEFEGREVPVTYTRPGTGLFDGPQPVESVAVRTLLPITTEYARAMPAQLARYESVRPTSSSVAPHSLLALPNAPLPAASSPWRAPCAAETTSARAARGGLFPASGYARMRETP